MILETRTQTPHQVQFVCLINAHIISARQHAERAICYRKSVCPSVRPSVTRVDQSKTVERIIDIL